VRRHQGMRNQSRKPPARVAAAIASFATLVLVNSLSRARAADSCTHDQICGLKNAEDLVRQKCGFSRYVGPPLEALTL
jgi:hypothetical protein